MGKKSRFSTMFCKKPIVFCGIFMVAFCLSIFDANAKLCNRYNPTSAGEFCKASSVQTCRAGCYCLGSKRSIEWILVDDYCKNRKTHDKYINSETYLKQINFDNQDILILYNTLLVNDSYTLKD